MSLRRVLLASALAVVVAATGAIAFAFVMVLEQRDATERDANGFIAEQHLSEAIVAITYRQQLAAMRYLGSRDVNHLREFRTLGDTGYDEIRQYLFHDLSNAARLEVERIKEAHQTFEVVAQRAFYLAEQGDVEGGLERSRNLDERSAALDSAVTRFIAARQVQREVLHRAHQDATRRVTVLLVGLVLLLMALVGALASSLRRRVLTPLRDLATAATNIGAGELDTRMAPQEVTEFDVVATAFNQMADRIQVARETMEAQNEEIRQTLDHLQEAQTELVQHEKLSAMGQMLAGLAHELNNPLAGILGLSELLNAELAASPYAAVRETGLALAVPLEEEALRARALVRTLLNFARRPSGVVESADLMVCVRTAVGMCAHGYAQAGKAINTDISRGLYVLADTQKLQHALVNVLNNALDAIAASGGAGARLTAAMDGENCVALMVDDDGPGFANVAAALTPFYTTKAPGKGTGLGLSLVQQYVSEFGGMVSVSNRPAGGARVTIILRRAESAPTHVEPEVVVTPRSSAIMAAEAPRGLAAQSSGARRVLVVDDEPSLRMILKRLLVRAGFHVFVAASGEEACTVLAGEDVDLVISDLRMPGAVDGYALLEWLQNERPALAATMLVSTGDSNDLRSRPIPLPPDRILSKPFQAAEFLRRVRQALNALGD